MNSAYKKISFKDIIEKKRIIEYDNDPNEIHYTYDEFIKIYDENIIAKNKKKILKQDLKKSDFLDEHSSFISNLLETLKDKQNFHGFMNDMKYNDMMNILYKNISVEKIIIDTEENEILDDEFY